MCVRTNRLRLYIEDAINHQSFDELFTCYDIIDYIVAKHPKTHYTFMQYVRCLSDSHLIEIVDKITFKTPVGKSTVNRYKRVKSETN